MADWKKLVAREDLKRKISLDVYVSEQMSEVGDSEHQAEARQRLDAFVQKLEPLAQPGDTWWEWVQGPPDTVPLMQQGGLALVRNGEIVWATMTWIS